MIYFREGVSAYIRRDNLSDELIGRILDGLGEEVSSFLTALDQLVVGSADGAGGEDLVRSAANVYIISFNLGEGVTTLVGNTLDDAVDQLGVNLGVGLGGDLGGSLKVLAVVSQLGEHTHTLLGATSE